VILLVDNYDSFTYNLVQMVGAMKLPFTVWRNDSFTMEEVASLGPSGIIISPGPGRPENTGMVLQLLEEYVPRVPVLGICLGHQALAYLFGGRIVYADRLMHGKASQVIHNGDPLFDGIPVEFYAARYHSLSVSPDGFPSCLKIICRDEQGAIMGIKHREYPALGLQFHPESIVTPHGERLMVNFINYYSIAIHKE